MPLEPMGRLNYMPNADKGAEASDAYPRDIPELSLDQIKLKISNSRKIHLGKNKFSWDDIAAAPPLFTDKLAIFENLRRAGVAEDAELVTKNILRPQAYSMYLTRRAVIEEIRGAKGAVTLLDIREKTGVSVAGIRTWLNSFLRPGKGMSDFGVTEK